MADETIKIESWDSMLQYWVWLTTKQGLSYRAQQLVAGHFGSMESAYLADASEYGLIDGLSKKEIELLEQKDLSQAERILTACTNKEIHLLTFQDAAYPERLRYIPNPPMVLYYTGTLPSFDTEPVIAIVGTRDASAYGLFCSKRLGYQIASSGGMVVSGLAKGIDTMAIQGALLAGKSVVGVMGCGVDVVYPKSNQALLIDVKNNGCLISEYPPGTPPLSSHFPVRNRILSGLSVGVVVVEAAVKSGALITANHALEQGRDVYAVPANIGVASSAGSNQLIKNGAGLIEDGWDVMREYVHLFPGKVTQTTAKDAHGQGRSLLDLNNVPPLPKVASPILIPTPADKLNVDKENSRDYIDLHKIMADLTDDEKNIVTALRANDLYVDDLIELCQIPAPRALAALTLLEVKGYVKRLPAKRFSLCLNQS